jgi:hypothetical protein
MPTCWMILSFHNREGQFSIVVDFRGIPIEFTGSLAPGLILPAQPW